MDDTRTVYQKKRDLRLSFEASINSGDVEAIQELLAPGKELYPDVNSPIFNLPPVMNALCDNDIPMLSALFVYGANLDVANEHGWHFSHELAKNTNEKLVTNLLPHIDLNRQNHEGVTPLMVAINEENWGVVEIFLNSNKNLRIPTQNNNGDTSLHLLVKAGRLDLFKSAIGSSEDALEGIVNNNNGLKPQDLIKDETTRGILDSILKEKLKEHLEKNYGGFPNIEDKPQVVESSVAKSVDSVDNLPKPSPMKPKGLSGIKKSF